MKQNGGDHVKGMMSASCLQAKVMVMEDLNGAETMGRKIINRFGDGTLQATIEFGSIRRRHAK